MSKYVDVENINPAEMKRMKRLTYYWMRGSENDGYYPKLGVSTEEVRQRLGEIEDMLGEDYDIERLKEIVKADNEFRCLILAAGGYTDKDGEQALRKAMYTCSVTNNAVNRYIADAIAEKLTRDSKDENMNGGGK